MRIPKHWKGWAGRGPEPTATVVTVRLTACTGRCLGLIVPMNDLFPSDRVTFAQKNSVIELTLQNDGVTLRVQICSSSVMGRLGSGSRWSNKGTVLLHED